MRPLILLVLLLLAACAGQTSFVSNDPVVRDVLEGEEEYEIQGDRVIWFDRI